MVRARLVQALFVLGPPLPDKIELALDRYPDAAQLVGDFLGVVAFQRPEGHLTQRFVSQAVEKSAAIFRDHCG